MTATPDSIRSYKIAIVQMLVLGGAKEKNISRAEQAIDEAARQGAKLALLPEALDLGWTHPTASSQAEAIPGGAPFLRLCQAAEKHQVFVCAGLTEQEGDQVFNAAVLIDEDPYGSAWREAYCPVARDFSVWFASASCVGPMTAGPWMGRNCIGCSLLVDAQGQVVLQGPYGADADVILYADIHLMERPTRGTGWQERIESSKVT